MATATPDAGAARILPYVSGKCATEILTCTYQKLRQLARDGAIRMRQLPGGHARYCLNDVLALAQAEPSEREAREAVPC
jgi:hypothetical protein